MAAHRRRTPSSRSCSCRSPRRQAPEPADVPARAPPGRARPAAAKPAVISRLPCGCLAGAEVRAEALVDRGELVAGGRLEGLAAGRLLDLRQRFVSGGRAGLPSTIPSGVPRAKRRPADEVGSLDPEPVEDRDRSGDPHATQPCARMRPINRRTAASGKRSSPGAWSDARSGRPARALTQERRLPHSLA